MEVYTSWTTKTITIADENLSDVTQAHVFMDKVVFFFKGFSHLKFCLFAKFKTVEGSTGVRKAP